MLKINKLLEQRAKATRAYIERENLTMMQIRRETKDDLKTHCKKYGLTLINAIDAAVRMLISQTELKPDSQEDTGAGTASAAERMRKARRREKQAIDFIKAGLDDAEILRQVKGLRSDKLIRIRERLKVRISSHSAELF